MQRTTVQECCRWGYGTSPVLVVAPHGGRRLGFAPRPRRALKVNDLHTAELACELARSLDASYVVNGTLDRNDVDLNRTSQTVRAAPWFLERLESMIGEILRRHATAEVLFVHGWNVVEPKCDIGIGARLAGESDAARASGLLTVSERYVEQRLGAFRTDCRRLGIHATFGERYPARHPDNVLQLFRRHGAAAAPEHLRHWIRDGRVEAVQLELGMPLRWPGTARERFVACVAATFGGLPSPIVEPPRNQLAAPLVQRPIAFQFYDPDRDLALLSSISMSSSGDVTGSRLLLLEEQGLELFLGEGHAPQAVEAAGLRIAKAGSEVHLDFDGWLLGLADTELYVDIEHAFAASRLLSGRAELALRPLHPTSGGRYGIASGWIERDGRRTEVRGFAFADPFLLHRPFDLGRSHLALSASLGSAGACVLRAGTGRHRFVRITEGGEVEHRHGTVRVDLGSDRATPERFEVHFAGEPALTGEPSRRVAIHRSLPGGRTARTTFGVARFRQGTASGFGFYDYSCLLGRA